MGCDEAGDESAESEGERPWCSKVVVVDPRSQPSGVAPTDLAFTLDGRFVVVAETFTSKIDTFEVVHGVAQPGNFQPSAGPLPFSCAINHDGFLLVSEIGNPDLSTFASSVSSYSI
jgi:hypothetical protein